MKELTLAILAGICVYTLLLLAAIGLDAFGTWLYGWDTGGAIFAIMAGLGVVPAALIGAYVYEEI